MRVRFPILAAIIIAIVSIQPSNAAVTFSVDLETGTLNEAGIETIQSQRSIIVGQRITASIIMDTTGDPGITAYNLRALFDPAVVAAGPLTLRGFSNEAFERGDLLPDLDTNRVAIFPFAFQPPMTVRSLGPLSTRGDVPNDDIGVFEGIAAGTTGVPFNLPFRSSIFDFTLTAIGPGDALVDNITLAGEGVQFAGETAVTDSDPRVTFQGARLSVSAIPEPSSVACLLVAGVAGLVRRRRR